MLKLYYIYIHYIYGKMNVSNFKNPVYSEEQSKNIANEFSRTKEVCYLDNAGAALYSEIQLESVFSEFSKNIYGNPHSRSLVSHATVDYIDIVRYQILSHFNTTPEEYSVIFTSGTTQALKILAETFDFKGGTFAYLEDNHTSVLGMRTYAPFVKEIKIEEAFHVLTDSGNHQNVLETNERNNLFLFPGQSNFSGTKYPLSWIEKVQNGGLNSSPSQKWFVALDAATLVSTNNLNLTKYRPDFVTVSFYKIFGYPTGLGALLVKKPSEKVLNKKYFGGGTVLMALSSENVMVPRTNISERFEDGTIPYLSIISLKYGFDTFKRLNLDMDLISRHTFALAQHIYQRLAELHHFNGNPVVVFYHDNEFESIDKQGGILNINLKTANGDYVGFAEVMHLANLHNIQLRTGCFCNPGACQKFLKLSSEDVRKQYEAGHICGDENDLINGFPTGSIRISLGYMSTYEDADIFLNMIESCFVSKPIVRKIRRLKNELKHNFEKKIFKEENKVGRIRDNYKNGREDEYEDQHQIGQNFVCGTLTKILLYPIKSCGPYRPQENWEITSTGLKYDRKWMIVNAAGSCVSQKQIKLMCLIKPIVDIKRNKLKIFYKDDKDFVELPLDLSKENNLILENRNGYFCESKVCGDKIQGWDCGDHIADWLCEKLGKPGLRLLRQRDLSDSTVARSSKKDSDSPLSLTNQGQYLLVNMASVRWLHERIPEGESIKNSNETTHKSILDSILLRFRPNLVVDFEEAFVENSLDSCCIIGSVTFQFSGNCTRCQMICVDQETGDISKEPLQTLSRELHGKIRFGVYLSHDRFSEGNTIEIGASVKVLEKQKNTYSCNIKY